MKKLLLLSAALCMLCGTTFAQKFGYGPKAGVIFSNAQNFPGATQRVGVVGGIFGDLMLTNWMALQTEFLYCMQGWEANSNAETANNPLNLDGKLKVALDYLKMPVLAKFYLIDGLNFQLGASFDYLISANYKYKGVNTSFKNNVNKYSVDFLTGLAYEFDFGLFIEGRYSIGMTSLQKNNGELGNNLKNGGLSLSLGWRF